MKRPECCPQPILFTGFDKKINNTDTSNKGMRETEDRIDGEHMTFGSITEPIETTGAFQK